MFVYTLAAYEKYYVLNREYLLQPIHMQLSIKTRDFFSILFCYFRTYIKFGTFSKKDDTDSYVFLKLQAPKNAVR